MNFRFEEEIVLENESVVLRPLSIPDIEHLLPIATSDQTLIQFSPKQIYTRELLTEYIQNAIIARTLNARYSFSIYSKLHGRLVGSTAFMNVSNADERLEIGATWIAKELHGTGFNRQCKHLMLQYAFDTVGAYRIEFRTDERNMRSRKAIEKIGGRFEGLLREHTLMYDGFRRNTYCYSILKSEWMPNNAK